ncbi:unnamed protein product, partial [marine sediment metagenome]
VVRHLRATELISGEPVPVEIVDLYRRYRREWMSLVEVGLREGWEWAKMMGPVPIGL